MSILNSCQRQEIKTRQGTGQEGRMPPVWSLIWHQQYRLLFEKVVWAAKTLPVLILRRWSSFVPIRNEQKPRISVNQEISSMLLAPYQRWGSQVFVCTVCEKPRIMSSRPWGEFSSLSARWVSRSRGNTNPSRALIMIITAEKQRIQSVAWGGVPEYRALVWLMQGCFSSRRHRR